MALANQKLIRALRSSAQRLRSGESYMWGHPGRCNCGFLATELTPLSANDLLEVSTEKPGDWTEHARAYCADSGLPVDEVITLLLREGLTVSDLEHLENLSGPNILKHIGRPLQRNQAADAAEYMETWAGLLENDFLVEELKGPEIWNTAEILKNRQVPISQHKKPIFV